MGRAGIVKQKIMIIKIRRKYFCVGISKVGHESNNFPPQDTEVAEEERESNLVQIIAHFLSCPIYTSCYNIYPVITETVEDHLKNKSRYLFSSLSILTHSVPSSCEAWETTTR